MGSPFSSSNRSQMSSNVYTTQNQGGGSKKAGFPYQVGKSSWSNVAINGGQNVSFRCCKLSAFSTLKFPLGCVSRPIDSRTTPYWNCAK